MSSASLVEALVSLVGNASVYVLWLLLALSVWATAIAIERWLFFRNTLGPLSAALRETRAALHNGPAAGWQPPSLGTLGDLYQRLWQDGHARELSEARLNDAVGRLRRSLMRRANVLGTLGANTPFIGLLGTVFGVIQAFEQLAKTTGKGADTVMAGIAEALVATGLGLFVAIPCVLFYNYFARSAQQAGDEVIEIGQWLAATPKQ